jgi:hypothetical protein
MILTGENGRTWRETCPSASLSTTNPTWTDMSANPGRHREMPVTNHLSHDMACKLYKCSVLYMSRIKGLLDEIGGLCCKHVY